MFPRLSRVLPALAVLAFSIVAFVFSLLAVTSRDWAVRDNYDVLLNPENWTTPIYTLYRSPFIICGATATILETNSTGGTSDSGTPDTITTYNVTCEKYMAFGFNRTSCELAIATLDDTASNLGDARLCQQIHYAGNFGIASTVCITAGFILTGFMAIATVLLAGFPGSPSPPDATTNHETGEQGSAQIESGKSNPHKDKESDRFPRHGHRGHRGHRRSKIIPYINLLTISLVTVGTITGIISQFYAVLGLIQSAPNNSDFASSAAGSNDDINTHGNHGPWYQGKALSVYATVAWGFAAAAGMAALKAWRLPTWDSGF